MKETKLTIKALELGYIFQQEKDKEKQNQRLRNSSQRWAASGSRMELKLSVISDISVFEKRTSGESKGVIGQKNEGLRHTAAARVNGPKVAKFLDR